MSWARRAVTSGGIWARILKSKVQSNLNICYIRKEDIPSHHAALVPIVGAFENVVAKKLLEMKTSKPLLTLTPLSLIECVSIQKPRNKRLMVKPTKASHPELFPDNKICEVCPIDLLDRLNLELGIIKMKQSEQIHRLLRTEDKHPTQKVMIILRIKKILATLNGQMVIERRKTISTVSDIIEETKKGSKKFRNIIDTNSKVIVKPWKTANEKYGILQKPEKANYFQEMSSFTKNKYLSSDLQMLHLNTINGRLRFNKQESRYKLNPEGQSVTSSCTFCTLNNRVNTPDEDSRHLYVDCPTSKLVLDNVCDKFLIPNTLPVEDFILYFKSDDQWLRLKYNLIFLTYRNYINRCRLFKNLPCKDFAIKLIGTKLKLVFACNPTDKYLFDGLLPILSCPAVDKSEILKLIRDSNCKDDRVHILYEAQKRTELLSTPVLEYMSNNLPIGTRLRKLQLYRMEQNKQTLPSIT
jgi:hypothetical protein